LADPSKTEKPTGKRIADARKKGNVAKSTDMNNAAVLLTASLLLYFNWPPLAAVLRNFMTERLGHFPTQDLTLDLLMHLARQVGAAVGVVLAPILLSLLLVGIAVNYVQVGNNLTFEPLKPKFDKLNPVNGLKRLFSLRSTVEALKGILKISIVGYICYVVIRDRYVELATAYGTGLLGLGTLIGSTAWSIVWRVMIALIVIGLVDFVYQRYEWEKGLKMTKQEVKDEWKQAEGSPEVKGEIKKRQRKLAQQRMMAEVPKASVVITNPTHFAVAVRYERETMEVPVVLAKGTDLVAKRIREIATDAGVPMIENKPIAQALYKQVEVGGEIPPELYAAVAEILVAVQRADRKVGA
jgi:flagellar biosynthetic protein FlhB